MASYSLGNYVRLLVSLGKTAREVFKAIKEHPRFRNSTNTIIANTLDLVRSAVNAAKRIAKNAASSKIFKRGIPKQTGDTSFLRIEYKFRFKFPTWSKTGKKGNKDVHEIIDVPFGLTKSDILSKIKERIREWIEEHYEENSANQRIPTPTIKLIYGV